MQLLPATARQVARKLDIDFRESLLDDPATNMTLGSTYLGPAGPRAFRPEDAPTPPPATVQWTYAFGPSGPAEA
jgi:soluble lytic murein transglycosylase-like protein